MISFFRMSLDKEKLLSLKGNRRVIIDTLLNNAQKHLFLDIEEIARELKTTPSTLSRIIRAIGFKSFKDFRTWIAKKAGFIFVTDEPVLKPDEKLLEDELEGVKALFAKDIIEILDKVTSLIDEKQSVIITGFGPFAILGEILKANLSMADIECEFIKNSKHETITAYHTLGKDTLLFLIDILQPYKEAIEILSIFKKRKIPRITLTSIPYSQLDMLSTLTIPIRVEKKHLIFPLAPAVAIIDLLSLKVIGLRKKKTQNKIKNLTDMMNDKELISELK